MATLVSTGQITIVDNNDARPITAFVTASNGMQQIYSKDESTISSTPDWSISNNILSAKVFVGGTSAATDITASLTSRKWSNDLSTSLGSGTTFTINANLDPAILASKIYYFEGDYTDPITGLVSHVIAQISISVVKTGTNAVYLMPRGTTAVQESNTGTKNVAVICVDLMRAAGVDNTGVTYQFYGTNGSVQVINTMTTLYGLKTTAAGVSPVGLPADIGVNLPAAAAWSEFNTIAISELAIANYAVIRAVAKDSDGVSYQCYFTVYDTTDAYNISVVSTAGEKLQNGVGSTNLYPQIWNGSTPVAVSDLAAWSFVWSFFDGAAPGNRAGLIDTTRTAQAGGRPITANTAGSGSVFTYTGAVITFAAGDMVKLVTATGLPKYFEVASGTTLSNLTLRTATISTFLNAVWSEASITLNQFAGGKLYVCAGTGSTAGTKTSTGGGAANYITLTGDEIDGKGCVTCDSYRP